MHVLIPALHRPTKPTGVCRHAVNLAQSLAICDRITRITLVVGEWQRAYFEQSFNLDSPKIELISVDINNSSLSRNQWFIFGLPKLSQSIQPDMIHLSFPFPFVRKWFKVPIVSTIHDLYPYECPGNFGYPQVLFNQLFLQQCIANSDGLACVSNITLESLKFYFPKVDKAKKNTVIYNCVDFAEVKPKIPNEQRFSEGNHSFILCIAQHRKNKNLDLLIQAYHLLLKAGEIQPSTSLVLVGSPGPETSTLETLIQTLDLQKQVILLSALTDEELCWLYKTCLLFVIPSSTEGFCLPLAEAVSLACPVVCSDIPIFREVGSANCAYFSLEGDAINHLANAMRSILNAPESPQLLVDPRFSRETIGQQLLDFYGV
jgi:glycosyltransferase involved in cell wall biosynthesis